MAILIIAAITISTFIGVFAFSLVSTDPSGGTGAWFVENDEPFEENAILALKFTITEATEVLETSSTIWLRGRGILTGEIPDFNPCSVSAWIGMDTPIVGAMILFHFSTEDMSGPAFSYQTYTGSATDPGVLLPGTYIYAINVACTAPSWANVFLWVSGTVNSGTHGDVHSGYCDDWNDDGIWHCCGGIFLHGIRNGEGGDDDTPDTNATEDGNVTKNGNLVTTGGDDDDEVDTELASNTAILGILILIIGFAFLAVGTKTNFAVVILGIIFLMIGLLLVAWSSFAMFGLVKAKKPTGKPPRRSAATKQAIVETKKAKLELRKRKIKQAIAKAEKGKAIHVMKAQKYNDVAVRLKDKLARAK
jgi:hypothetical protein